MRRPTPVLIPILAAAAMTLLAGCDRQAPAQEPTRAVRTLTVGQGDAPMTREYAAEVRARTEARLGFRVPGKLTNRLVNAGDRVRAGQVLAQLDPADLQLSQEAANAALRAAQVNYEQTETDYRRYVDLRAQGFISEGELQRRDAGLKSARSTLDQARAQAGVQTHQTGYATLAADGPGVITEVDADAGTVVAAGTPIVKLAYDGPRDVVFAIPEDQVDVFRGLRGKAGALSVSLWRGGAPFKATVREIAGAADPVTRTFQVKADLPPNVAELGQSATVQAQVAAADAALRLPNAAVAEHAGQSIVWLVDKGTMTVRQQPVAIARPDGDNLVIASGLKTGDIVVTAGAHALAPNQKVSFWTAPVASH
jgi:RND family efflux transporter MFP subunit